MADQMETTMIDEVGKEYYDNLKSEYMDEDQLDMASQIMDWFRASWYDKQFRGMFDKYQDAEVYWEGTSNEAYYEDDPASNTNIVHPNIETLVSLTVDTNMDVECDGQTASEDPYITPINAMVRFIMQKNKTPQKAYSYSRRMHKFGNGAFLVYFDPDRFNGMGLPWYESLNPAYLFTDPNILFNEDLNESEFMIYTKIKNIHSAREKYGPIAECIFPDYDLIEDVQIFGEEDSGYNYESKQRYIHMICFFRSLIPRDAAELEYDDDGEPLPDQDFFDPKMRMIEMSADGVILRDTFRENDPPFFPEEKYPIYMRACYEKEGTVWGMADLELLKDPQNQLNDYDDQIRSNARLFGNPQKWVDPTSGFEIDQWTNERGLILPIVGGKENAGYFAINAVSQDVIDRRDRIYDVDAPKQVRVNSQMMGQRQKGVDSATEALSLRESSNSVTEPKTYKIQDVLEDVLLHCFQLGIHYWEDDMFFRLTGKKSPISFNPSKLENIPALEPADDEFLDAFKENNPDAEAPEFMTVQDMSGNDITKFAEINIKVKVGSGASKNPSFTYSIMKDSGANGLIPKSEYQSYLKNELDMPISQETIDRQKYIEDLQFKQLTAAAGGQPSQASAGLTGGNEPNTPNTVQPNLEGGTPGRPQSAMRGMVGGLAQNS